MDSTFSQPDLEKLKSKINTVISFLGRPNAVQSANASRTLSRAKDDNDAVSKLPSSVAQLSATQQTQCKGMLGYYNEVVRNLAGLNTIDLDQLDRDFRNQKAVLLSGLDNKVRAIIQKGSVELLKANLGLMNVTEVPSIFTYAISLTSEVVATEMVRVLLEHKQADPGADGNRALILAVEKGYTEVVRLLVEDPRTDPSVNNDQLLKTAHKNSQTVIKEILLSDFRVDPSAINDT